MLSKIFYILLALVVLMILITVHEFGHYIAGKIFKFKINEFSIGFGKAIYKKTKKDGEIFSIRILPLGGYCAFEGEDEENPGHDAFNSKPAWQRLIVLFSGVFFNFIFGILTSAIYLMVAGYGVPVVSSARTEVMDNWGLQIGDKIVAVNDRNIEAYRPIGDLLSDYNSDAGVTLTIVRDGEEQELYIEKISVESGYFYMSDYSKIKDNLYVSDGTNYVAYSLDDFSQNLINAGVETVGEEKLPQISTTFYTKNEDGEYEKYEFSTMIKDGTIVYVSGGTTYGFIYYQTSEKYGFFESLGKAWPFSFYICGVILGALGGIFTGATALKELGGTITTISEIAKYSAISPLVILYLFPMLSLNLAIFNILPIPALDGARMCFVLWEAITKKPVNRKVEGWIHTIGLFVLLALVIFLDVYHMIIAPLIG